MNTKVILGEGAKEPFYATTGSAGFDISSTEELTLLPGEKAIVGTGLFFEIPEGYELQIRPRSGNAAKHSVTVLNSPGTIDSDYRGEVKVILFNAGKKPFPIKAGDRIAQGVVSRVFQLKFEFVKELSETERGEGGFGSTGK